MTVYVDPLRRTCSPRLYVACHMMADTDTELKEMARLVGLRADWRDGDHYDLSPSKRRQAVRRGAREVHGRYLVRLRQARRAQTLKEQS